MEERVHPIPFRTRQLSSPSSMILRTLTWESRTTPRLYFQRAVLSRTALCFARTHPPADHPSPSPRLGASPSCSFSLSPLPSGFLLPPSSFFLRLYPPGRSIIGVSLPFPSLPFPSSLFPQASSICRRRALEGLCLRGKGGHGIVSLIGKCLLATPRNQTRDFERWAVEGIEVSLQKRGSLPSYSHPIS